MFLFYSFPLPSTIFKTFLSKAGLLLNKASLEFKSVKAVQTVLVLFTELRLLADPLIVDNFTQQETEIMYLIYLFIDLFFWLAIVYRAIKEFLVFSSSWVRNPGFWVSLLI